MEEDVDAIRREAGGLSAVSSEYSTSMKLHLDLKTWPVDVSGVSPEFGRMRNLIPQAGGRFIDPVDMNEQRRVVFLGDKLAANVFGKAEDAVGRTVMLGSSPFPRDRRSQDEEPGLELQRRDNDRASIPGTTYRALTGREVRRQPHLPGRRERSKPNLSRGGSWRSSETAEIRPGRQGSPLVGHDGAVQVLRHVHARVHGLLGIVGSLTLVVGGSASRTS